jgi:hypothetical protein
MTKIKPGTILTYHEMGEACSVKVLEDNSDDEQISLELEIIEVFTESALCETSKPGEQFEAAQMRKYGRQQGGWWIEELEEN